MKILGQFAMGALIKLFAFFLFLVLMPVDTSASTPRVGVAGAVNYSVTAKAARAIRTLKIGSDIFFEETIITDATGNTQLLFIDKSALMIGPNSRVVIDKFIYNPADSTGDLTISVTKGTLRFIGGALSKKKHVKIKTPVSTIGIRGGIVMVEVGPNGETSAAFLYGLEMYVKNDAGIQVTREIGSMISVLSAFTPPTPPVHIAPDTLSFTLAKLRGQKSTTGGARIKASSQVIDSKLGKSSGKKEKSKPKLAAKIAKSKPVEKKKVARRKPAENQPPASIDNTELDKSLEMNQEVASEELFEEMSAEDRLALFDEIPDDKKIELMGEEDVAFVNEMPLAKKLAFFSGDREYGDRLNYFADSGLLSGSTRDSDRIILAEADTLPPEDPTVEEPPPEEDPPPDGNDGDGDGGGEGDGDGGEGGEGGEGDGDGGEGDGDGGEGDGDGGDGNDGDGGDGNDGDGGDGPGGPGGGFPIDTVKYLNKAGFKQASISFLKSQNIPFVPTCTSCQFVTWGAKQHPPLITTWQDLENRPIFPAGQFSGLTDIAGVTGTTTYTGLLFSTDPGSDGGFTLTDLVAGSFDAVIDMDNRWLISFDSSIGSRSFGFANASVPLIVGTHVVRFATTTVSETDDATTITGTINGALFGPQAEEMGGNFDIEIVGWQENIIRKGVFLGTGTNIPTPPLPEELVTVLERGPTVLNNIPLADIVPGADITMIGSLCTACDFVDWGIWVADLPEGGVDDVDLATIRPFVFGDNITQNLALSGLGFIGEYSGVTIGTIDFPNQSDLAATGIVSKTF